MLLGRGAPLDELRLFLGSFDRSHVRRAARYQAPWPMLYLLDRHGAAAEDLAEGHPALALAVARLELFEPTEGLAGEEDALMSSAAALLDEGPIQVAIRLGFGPRLSLLQKIDVETVTAGDLLGLRYLARHSTRALRLLDGCSVITGPVISILLMVELSILSGPLLDEIATADAFLPFRDDLQMLRECERLSRKTGADLLAIMSRRDLQLRLDGLQRRHDLLKVGLAGHPLEGRRPIEPVTSLEDLREKIQQAGLRTPRAFRHLHSVQEWKRRFSTVESAPVYFARTPREQVLFVLEQRGGHWQVGSVLAQGRAPLRSTRKAIRDWWRNQQTTSWAHPHTFGV